jgi:hypothetical protein
MGRKEMMPQTPSAILPRLKEAWVAMYQRPRAEFQQGNENQLFSVDRFFRSLKRDETDAEM